MYQKFSNKFPTNNTRVNRNYHHEMQRQHTTKAMPLSSHTASLRIITRTEKSIEATWLQYVDTSTDIIESGLEQG